METPRSKCNYRTICGDTWYGPDQFDMDPMMFRWVYEKKPLMSMMFRCVCEKEISWGDHKLVWTLELSKRKEKKKNMLRVYRCCSLGYFEYLSRTRNFSPKWLRKGNFSRYITILMFLSNEKSCNNYGHGLLSARHLNLTFFCDLLSIPLFSAFLSPQFVRDVVLILIPLADSVKLSPRINRDVVGWPEHLSTSKS